MKSKQLITLLAILAAAGITAALKMRSRSAAIGGKPQEVGKPILGSFEPENVGGFTITDGKESVEVAFKDGKWILPARDGFPASLTAVNELRDTSRSRTSAKANWAGSSSANHRPIRRTKSAAK
jgi:hypothetical protein